MSNFANTNFSLWAGGWEWMSEVANCLSMGTLDQITKMKKQGIPEQEIIDNLSQQGISPREISDAMKQSQIKSAVSSVGDMGDEMQSSMMPEGEAPAPIEDQDALKIINLNNINNNHNKNILHNKLINQALTNNHRNKNINRKNNSNIILKAEKIILNQEQILILL